MQIAWTMWGMLWVDVIGIHSHCGSQGGVCCIGGNWSVPHCTSKHRSTHIHVQSSSIISMVNENAWALTRLPGSCPPCQFSCPKTSRDVMMSHHNVMWCHMTWQSESSQVNLSETTKITIFNLATLAFDLWPSPSNSFRLCASVLDIKATVLCAEISTVL